MRTLCVIGLLLISISCAPRPPVRHAGTSNAADLKEIAENPVDSDAYRRVQNTSLEPHDAYTLSFVELNSRGRLARAGQREAAEESIRQMSGKGVVVLFVHGWGHNADALDSHVQGFRRSLAGLKEALPGRTVTGIYVSWPARWLKDPQHYLTFWDRSRAAQAISRTHEVEALLQGFRKVVEERRQEGTEIVSVAVGHSLGGKFLFTPMEERLERARDARCSVPLDDLPLFGDLVLLVNAAQDVHDFEAFDKYALCPQEETHPVVAIFASEGDQVVGRTFKIGRILRNLVTPWNWPSFVPESIGLGWDPDQVTHTLCSTKAGPDPKSECARGEHVDVIPYGSTELRRKKDERQGPFIVVRVDGHIITKHGDIFNEEFLGFLRAFVAQNVRKGTVAARRSPTPPASHTPP